MTDYDKSEKEITGKAKPEIKNKIELARFVRQS